MLMLPDFRVRQRDFLLEILRAITAQLDLGEVLKRALEASIAMLAGQMGFVALRSSDGRFYVRAIIGLDSSLIPVINNHLHDILPNIDEGVDFPTFEQKLPLMMTEIDAALKQSVALPLVVAGEPLGMMIVFRTFRSNATVNDLQILQSFADQAAIAVHNAQLYEHIDHERKRLVAILEYSGDGVMILSANLTILRVNKALERITAWPAGDAIGQHQSAVIVWKRLEGGDLQQALDEGWPFSPAYGASAQTGLYVEGDLLRRDGLPLSIGITYAPLLNAEGRLANIIANVRDVTNFRKSQEMQSTFVSVISHELKTPVAIIKGYAATLRRPDANWEPHMIQEYLAVIEDEADRLNALIQNLLTASRLQVEREMSLDRGEVWLSDLVETAVLRMQGQSANHEFYVSFPPDFPTLIADEARLRQVIDNLLSNAVKYSPDGGRIEVGGSHDDHTITVYVRDPGVGLTPEDQARVFDRFYRVEGSLSRKTQGAGLGLFLAKAIIEAHGGMMGVNSELGQGATFYFTLPRLPQASFD